MNATFARPPARRCLPTTIARMSLIALAPLGIGSVWAMNGGQLGGYGTKASAMGGASIALPQDALAAANNPAGMAFVPQIATNSIVVFSGNSESDWALPGNRIIDNTRVVAPEVGFNWVLNPTMTAGLTLVGQGAGVDYQQPLVPAPLIAGMAQNAFSSLKTLDIIGTVTWKLRPDLAIGVGPTLSVQRFRQEGVVVPIPGAAAPPIFAAVPSHGSATATGFGLRLGILWHASPEWSLGASYRSKTRMGKLGDYGSDLLAYSEGRLDIPDQFGVGLAWRAAPSLTLAADWLQINWRSSKSQQDPNGPYWRDQPVLRLGAMVNVSPQLTLRAGLSRNRRQILESNAAQNVFSPAINDRAYTAGASWKLASGYELSFAYELNPRQTLRGTGLSAGTTLTSKVQVFKLDFQFAF